jgi:serine/threonine protein phosphatase PrpC
MPCQDALAVCSWSVAGTDYLVTAVADGHGGAAYDRSHIGAALAVRAASEEFQALLFFGAAPRAPEDADAEDLAGVTRAFKADFGRLLVRRWRRYVQEDAGAWNESAPPAQDADTSLFRHYGTTLLVACVGPQSVLVGQIGDGDVLFLRADDSVAQPLPADDQKVGGETDSLSMPDAPRLFRTAVFDHEERGLLLLASDGVGNAMREGGLEKLARSVSASALSGALVQVVASLPGFLERCSSQGSGDDVTISMVILGQAKPATESLPAGAEVVAPLAEDRVVAAGPPAPASPEACSDNQGGGGSRAAGPADGNQVDGLA